MFRLDRSRRAGRYLEWRVGLFLVGAVLGLAGMLLEEGWMVGSALGVLLLGVAVRFLPERGFPAEDPMNGERERSDGEGG